MNIHIKGHSKTITVILISLSTLLISASLGINSVILPVSLENISDDTKIVGFILSLDVIASIIIALILSRLLKRFDARLILLLSTLIRVPPILVFNYFSGMGDWAILIFLHGIGISLFYIITQAWVNSLPLSTNRGLVIGIFNTTFALGVALGPVSIRYIEVYSSFLQPLQNILAFTPYLEQNFHIALIASAVLSLAGTLPLFLLLDPPPALEAKSSSSIWSTIRQSQNSMFAVAMAGVSISGVMAFITIYGQRNGLNLDDSALLLTSFITGSLVLQTPFAWLSDIFERRLVLIIAAFTSMCCAAVLPIFIYVNYQAWLLVFVWGGVIGGIYSITMAMLGDEFQDKDLVNANSGYEIMDNIGGVFGVIVIGLSMDWLGPDGLPYVIMFSSILYYSYSLTRFKVV